MKFLVMTKTPSLFPITLMLATTSAIFGSPAATPAIGMAVANGSFQVDRMRMSGNASLFDGSVIETANSSSQIQLNTGQRLRLSSETRAKIYRNKLVLESGFGQMETAPVLKSRPARCASPPHRQAPWLSSASQGTTR